MPRVRKPSDELVNKRKRVQRAIKSLEKSLQKPLPESERKIRKDYISRLQKGLKQTYIGRISDKGQRLMAIAQANRRLDVLVKRAREVRGGTRKTLERERSMAIFKTEMRAAAKGEESVFGQYGREKINIFFRYTQNIWDKPSVPREQRIEAVMKAYDVDNVNELFERVMSENRQALDYVKALHEGTYEIEDDTNYDGGSPEYLLAVDPDVIR